MKMHFCIPVSQQRPDTLGGRYVLYSVYLDGFLFCKVRYSQLHRWNEQLRRVFGNHLPPFPPKYYLAMTTSMADERRDQLEQYLQNVTADPNMSRSDVFVEFLKLVQLPVTIHLQAGLKKTSSRGKEGVVALSFKNLSLRAGQKVQQNTFCIPTKKAALDVHLPDGRSVHVEILTSDTAERVLEVVSHKLGLHRELSGYFGLFLIRCCKESKLSVVKKLVDFELPYVTLQSSEVENCKVGFRKWYLDPALDSMLMDCPAARDLLYMQALRDIEIEWTQPTQAQREALEALQKEESQTKFLELCQEVQHYGCIQLDPCTCDHPEPGCGAVLSIGNYEISCCITLPNGQTQNVTFQMSRVKCWQVTFLGTLLDMEGPQRTLNQNLELRFQFNEDSRWQWFVVYTKQAFLLSSCLKKMISEKMTKLAAENPEMILGENPIFWALLFHQSEAKGKDTRFSLEYLHSHQEGSNFWFSVVQDAMLAPGMCGLLPAGPLLFRLIYVRSKFQSKEVKSTMFNKARSKDYSSFLTRKSKVKRAGGDCVFGILTEEDL